MHRRAALILPILASLCGCASAPPAGPSLESRRRAALDVEASRSAPSVPAEAPPPPRSPAISRALVMGVRGYQTQRLPELAAAESDAVAVHRFLQSRGARAKLMIGEAVERAGVEQALEATAVGTGGKDTVLVYYGGYVSVDPSDASSVYLMTQGAGVFSPAERGVPVSALFKASQRGGGHWIFAFDGVRDAAGGPGSISHQVREALLAMAERFSNVTVLLSGERSREGVEWRKGDAEVGGAFAHMLLLALEGRADSDRDGAVQLPELVRFVVLATREATEGRQVPQVVGPLQSSAGPVAWTAQPGAARAAAAAGAARYRTFDDFERATGLLCHPPAAGVESAQERIIDGRRFLLRGSTAELADKDADKRVRLGVLGSLKQPDEATVLNLRRALGWFRKQGVDAVVVNGDLGADEKALARAFEVLAAPGLPVLVMSGNVENVVDFNGAAGLAARRFGNIVNMNHVRLIDLEDAQVLALPGYHDRAFLRDEGGCLYGDTEVELALAAAREARKDAPVVLVAHGPPQGRTAAAVDYIEGVGNVGDARLNRLIEAGGIPFGVFGHILEAGGQAANLTGTRVVAQGAAAEQLYLNVGGVNAAPFKRNGGGVSTGMAFILSIEDGRASYEGVNLGAW